MAQHDLAIVRTIVLPDVPLNARTIHDLFPPESTPKARVAALAPYEKRHAEGPFTAYLAWGEHQPRWLCGPG
ncbi:hypothetical protein [Paraburkholderia sp. 40]|uniref:hypothetical protein n=1 Tax=Paraburkholderia sp. 40 TaxID=2991059 RepID=UPI003D1DC7EC